MKSHPAKLENYLNSSAGYDARIVIANATFENMWKGNTDLLEFSQQTILETAGGKPLSPSEQFHLATVDPKRDFSEQPLSWGLYSTFGSGPDIAEAFAGKRLSDIDPSLQGRAERLLKFFESAPGQTALRADGLTNPQIDKAVERLRGLVDNGFPPFLAKEAIKDTGFFLPLRPDEEIPGTNPKVGKQSYKSVELSATTEYNKKQDTVSVESIVGRGGKPTEVPPVEIGSAAREKQLPPVSDAEPQLQRALETWKEAHGTPFDGSGSPISNPAVLSDFIDTIGPAIEKWHENTAK